MGSFVWDVKKWESVIARYTQYVGVFTA